jgi:hypothetical protein
VTSVQRLIPENRKDAGGGISPAYPVLLSLTPIHTIITNAGIKVKRPYVTLAPSRESVVAGQISSVN